MKITTKDYTKHTNLNWAFVPPEERENTKVWVTDMQKIIPDGYIIEYNDGTWENLQDHRYKERFINRIIVKRDMLEDYDVFYDRGYICGTSSPIGEMKGLMSANHTNGYEMWQRLSIRKKEK